MTASSGTGARPEPSCRIRLARDGSEDAKRSEEVGIELARRYGAELIVVNAVSFPFGAREPESHDVGDLRALTRYSDFARAEANKIMQEGVALAQKAGIKTRGRCWTAPHQR